jgi:Acetamidase/Formamidase family
VSFSCPHRSARERRQPRHQELHPWVAGVLPRPRARSLVLRRDLHLSQGDGEITFCRAIEMGGFIDFHIDLIKGCMETYGGNGNRS